MPPSARELAKRLVMRHVPTLLYRRPVSALAPERLYAYLDALWERRELDGAVVEVGAWLGGTATLAYRMLRNTGFPKRYVCVDTFGGFVPEQFQHDLEHGTRATRDRDFAANSREAVERLLRSYGVAEIELVEGDIARVPDERLPDQVSVGLVDVDLEVPVYEGLRRLHPRLAPGGVLLVDDCPEGYNWPGARIGYKQFVDEHGLEEQYFMGMGLVHA